MQRAVPSKQAGERAEGNSSQLATLLAVFVSSNSGIYYDRWLTGFLPNWDGGWQDEDTQISPSDQSLHHLNRCATELNVLHALSIVRNCCDDANLASSSHFHTLCEL
jgi:hypothetical protein